MGLPAITQNLAMYETALYGGYGLGGNSAVPSYTNNYMASSANLGNYGLWGQPNYNNFNNYGTYPNFYGNGMSYPSVYDYNNYSWNSPTYSSNNSTVTSQGSSNNVATTGKGSGLSLAESTSALREEYAKGLTFSQTMGAAAVSGVSIGLMQNPRVVAHPINTIRSLKPTRELFKDVKVKGSHLNTLWKENSYVMQEAYYNLNRLEARKYSKLGLFRHKYSDSQYKALKQVMEDVLKNPASTIDDVAKATAHLNKAYVNDGFFKRFGYNVKRVLSGKKRRSAVDYSKLVINKALKGADIAKAGQEIVKVGTDTSFKGLFKMTGGMFGAIFTFGSEIFMDVDKLKAAYAKDKELRAKGEESNLGNKQLKQTLVRSTLSASSWIAGETLGRWGMAKLGAKIGTFFGPGVGTAIGAVAGYVLGSVCSSVVSNIVKKKQGAHAGSKVIAEEKTQSIDGLQEMAMDVIQRAEKGEKIDPKAVEQAVYIVQLIQDQQQYLASTGNNYVGPSPAY